MLRRPSPTASRRVSSGSIRPAGLVAATLTAAAVFGLGMLILPPIEDEEPPAPPAAPAPAPVEAPPAAPAPPPEPVAPVADASTTDATPVAEAAPKVPPAPAARSKADTPAAPEAKAEAPKPEAKPEPAKAEPPPKAEAPKAEASKADAPKAEGPSAREKTPEKEVAREAWRKNLPDISPEPGKAALLIPIKGSIEGATYHVTAKPKSVLVTLPKGESMITMPFYNIRHDGFRQLWIKKDDSGSTSLRIVLGDASDPQVEIKEDFVRVVVRRPAETPAAPGAAPTPSPAGASEPPAPSAVPEAPAPTPARD